MCLIKSFEGMNGYKDWESVRDVISYAFNSRYYAGCIIGNIEGYSDPDNIISQFYQVYSMRTDMANKKKIHHLVISYGDMDLSEGAVINLMEQIKSYFKKRHFQVVIVRHYRSEDRFNNQHLHVIVNHCNLKGTLWYGNDAQYLTLKDYLINATHYPWTYIYGKMEDYEGKFD